MPRAPLPVSEVPEAPRAVVRDADLPRLPLRADGSPDLRAVIDAARRLGPEGTDPEAVRARASLARRLHLRALSPPF